jgi:cytidine deaminase
LAFKNLWRLVEIPSRDPTPDEEWLYEAATVARQRAYVPYSQFSVGAALLTASMGPISGHPAPVTAANVENASYGLTICAERSAVVRAIAEGLCPEAMAHSQAAASEGGKKPSPACITAIAVAGPDHTDTVSPCGACRQVLSQFAAPETTVTFKLDGSVRTVDFSALLPARFEL